MVLYAVQYDLDLSNRARIERALDAIQAPSRSRIGCVELELNVTAPDEHDTARLIRELQSLLDRSWWCHSGFRFRQGATLRVAAYPLVAKYFARVTIYREDFFPPSASGPQVHVLLPGGFFPERGDDSASSPQTQ